MSFNDERNPFSAREKRVRVRPGDLNAHKSENITLTAIRPFSYQDTTRSCE